MPVIYAKAPGKIILFGEHAVVYGQPAIAIPVHKVYATARVIPDFMAPRNEVRIKAPDIQLDAQLADLPGHHPFAHAIRLTLEALTLQQLPACTLVISSTIPIAAGMGSSAAISVAIIRALSDFLGTPLSPDTISSLAFEVEKIHHGTPSGIDNTVIAHQTPVFFTLGRPIEHLAVEQPTHWVIADSGEKTPTRKTVADVRALHAADPEAINDIFQQIGDIAKQAQTALATGDLHRLGLLMDENQRLLDQLTVSSPSLENLIMAARTAGAVGAKLSGGGRGGNIIALAPSEDTQAIADALRDAGATRVITTTLTKGRR
ncbi:MAG: mevalonate kinase [Brevefilum sp.]